MPRELQQRLEVESHLGAGWVGDVYKVRWKGSDRHAVIKLFRGVPADVAATPEFVGRWLAVARDAPRGARGVVDLIDAGIATTPEGDPLPWIVSAASCGMRLDRWLARHQPLDVPAVAELGVAIADALRGAGLAPHLALHPRNIHVDGGARNPVITVVDHGQIAALTSLVPTRGLADEARGGWFAPEQLGGERAGRRQMCGRSATSC